MTLLSSTTFTAAATALTIATQMHAQEADYPMMDPVPEYDVLEGPPGMNGVQTPEEFFGSENGQTFLNGMQELVDRFNDGVSDVERMEQGLPPIAPPPAESIEVATNPEGEQRVVDIMRANCQSFEQSAITLCARTDLEAALGVSNEFLAYIAAREDTIDPADYRRVTQSVGFHCTTMLNAVHNQQWLSVNERVSASITTAERCAVVVGDQGKSIGYDFAPITRAAITDLASNVRDINATYSGANGTPNNLSPWPN